MDVQSAVRSVLQFLSKQLWAAFLAHQALLFLPAFGFEVSRGQLIGAILPDELLLGFGQHS